MGVGMIARFVGLLPGGKREEGRSTQPFSFEFSCLMSVPSAVYLCIKILKRSPLLMIVLFILHRKSPSTRHYQKLKRN